MDKKGRKTWEDAFNPTAWCKGKFQGQDCSEYEQWVEVSSDVEGERFHANLRCETCNKPKYRDPDGEYEDEVEVKQPRNNPRELRSAKFGYDPIKREKQIAVLIHLHGYDEIMRNLPFIEKTDDPEYFRKWKKKI